MRVPIVKFWDVTLEDFDHGGKRITDEGIEKHPDVPEGWVCPLETALFHELGYFQGFSRDVIQSAMVLRRSESVRPGESACPVTKNTGCISVPCAWGLFKSGM